MAGALVSSAHPMQGRSTQAPGQRMAGSAGPFPAFGQHRILTPFCREPGMSLPG